MAASTSSSPRQASAAMYGGHSASERHSLIASSTSSSSERAGSRGSSQKLTSAGSGRPRSQSAADIAAAAGRLDLEQLERAAVAVEQQPVAVGAHAAAGGRERLAVDLRGDDAEEGAVRERQARADVRAQRAHDALDLLGRARGVERAVARLDLVRVGHALLGLLDERRPLVERADEQVAAELAQARRQRPVVVVGPDRLAPLAGRRARSPARRSGA